jgi:hypothetical protein
MKPEAQRTAIAQACGWKRRGHHGWSIAYWCDPRGSARDSIPDYLSDLNAMHEAEKQLSVHLSARYENILISIIRPEWKRSDYTASWLRIHATAAQRAEAFLRTLNLWEDDPS